MAKSKRNSERGLGPEAGGQSGDTEEFSEAELADLERARSFDPDDRRPELAR
jgi:hypothetical protein